MVAGVLASISMVVRLVELSKCVVGLGRCLGWLWWRRMLRAALMALVFVATRASLMRASTSGRVVVRYVIVGVIG